MGTNGNEQGDESVKVEKPDLRLLAIHMLQWEEMQKKIGELETLISDAVLKLEKTVITGNITASFGKGTNKYEGWETAFNMYVAITEKDEGDIALLTREQYTDTTSKVDHLMFAELAKDILSPSEFADLIKEATIWSDQIDWQATCKELGIVRKVEIPGTPKVTVKFK